jgi:hypothetical protein
MDQIIIPENMEPIVVLYFQNNAKKLNNMVDKILFKLRFVDIDKNDFYSLANEVFMYAVRDYDKSQSFDRFLYSCLYKKFCTEMTSRKRDKRCTKVKVKEKNEKGEVIEKIVIIPDVSIYSPIGEDESSTIEDIIADETTIEKEVFDRNEEGYSKKMLLYLSRLSNLQKEVLRLNIAGYLPSEIREELHIDEKEYTDCYAAIHSYRNVSVLF